MKMIFPLCVGIQECGGREMQAISELFKCFKGPRKLEMACVTNQLTKTFRSDLVSATAESRTQVIFLYLLALFYLVVTPLLSWLFFLIFVAKVLICLHSCYTIQQPMQYTDTLLNRSYSQVIDLD